jgi:hypothetical protein
MPMPCTPVLAMPVNKATKKMTVKSRALNWKERKWNKVEVEVEVKVEVEVEVEVKVEVEVQDYNDSGIVATGRIELPKERNQNV